MKRAVISTPVPTLDEVAESYGIGKRRQVALMSIVRKHTGVSVDAGHRDSGAFLRQRRADSAEVIEKAKVHRSKK